MPDHLGNSPTRPWWVRLAIPAASARRRDVLRNTIIMSALGGLWGAVMIVLAFMDVSGLYAYRWFILAFFATAWISLLAEFLAIRWTDRAGLWQQ